MILNYGAKCNLYVWRILGIHTFNNLSFVYIRESFSKNTKGNAAFRIILIKNQELGGEDSDSDSINTEHSSSPGLQSLT